jgi:hypothetical protein
MRDAGGDRSLGEWEIAGRLDECDVCKWDCVWTS